MIRGVSVSTQKRAQKLSVRHGLQRRAKLAGRTFKRSLTNRRGRPVEIRSFVTANVIVRAVHREYLEAFQSPTTFRQLGNTSFQSVLLSAIESRTGTKKRTRAPKTLRIKEISLIWQRVLHLVVATPRSANTRS